MLQSPYKNQIKLYMITFLLFLSDEYAFANLQDIDSAKLMRPKNQFALPRLPHISGLDKISCYQDNCTTIGITAKVLAFDNYVLTSLTSFDKGKSWSRPTSLLSINKLKIFKSKYLNDISCTNNNCVTVGYFKSEAILQPLIYSKKLNAKFWSAPMTPLLPQHANGGSLYSVTCEYNFCVAVGEYYNYSDSTSNSYPLSYYSLDGGESWVLSIAQPAMAEIKSATLSKVTCHNKVCLALGRYREASYPEHNQIQHQQINQDHEKPIAFKSYDGGMTWSTAIFLPQVDNKNSVNLTAVACNGNNCIVAGNIIDRTTVANTTLTFYSPIIYHSQDGGITWLSPIKIKVPHDYCNTEEIKNITCSNQACLIIAGKCYQDNYDTIHQPQIYISTDNGTTWSGPNDLQLDAKNINSKHLYIHDVTCDVQRCIAVGEEEEASFLMYSRIITSNDGGITWS